VQFVIRYTKGVSSTESLNKRLKSKHRIHENEDDKTIPAQKEIRSQIVKKEMSLFEPTKKRSNKLKLHHALITIKPISVQPEGFFSHGTICHKAQRQTE